MTEIPEEFPVGDDGLTDAEREQYAAQWRNGSGSKTLALPPENLGDVPETLIEADLAEIAARFCPFCGSPVPCGHRAGG
jgi:hypothetical protein